VEDVLAKDRFNVAPPEHQGPVQALGAYGPHKTLRVRVSHEANGPACLCPRWPPMKRPRRRWPCTRRPGLKGARSGSVL
jgi:hypothetical protein